MFDLMDRNGDGMIGQCITLLCGNDTVGLLTDRAEFFAAVKEQIIHDPENSPKGMARHCIETGVSTSTIVLITLVFVEWI